MKNERHNLSMLTFPSAPDHVRPPRQTTGLVSASPESQPSSSDAKTKHWFFSNPQILCACFRCMTSFTSPGHFLSGIFILTSLNDTSSTRAHEHLRSCLHLTNLCTERKVLILTKLIGKIYKTKFLSHYITNDSERCLQLFQRDKKEF